MKKIEGKGNELLNKRYEHKGCNFFFNEDKIEQYSKDLIGGKFYNNCHIPVIKK